MTAVWLDIATFCEANARIGLVMSTRCTCWNPCAGRVGQLIASSALQLHFGIGQWRSPTVCPQQPMAGVIRLISVTLILSCNRARGFAYKRLEELLGISSLAKKNEFNKAYSLEAMSAIRANTRSRSKRK